MLKLSLVIPVYNEENHLNSCLEAIAQQSTAPDEVIMVDNNSTDGSLKKLQEYTFVRVVPESVQGIVFARNTGFNAANCELIGRIDADTVLPPDWVATVKAFYAKPENAKSALVGGASYRNMPLPGLTRWMQKQLVFRLNWLALGHHILWGSNMVIPRDAWEKVKNKTCPLPYIHEDIDLAIHLHEEDLPITYMPELQVSAVLRRVLSERDKLWPNLKWWPRTLRRHHKKRWVIALYAAGSVYLLAIVTRMITRQRD